MATHQLHVEARGRVCAGHHHLYLLPRPEGGTEWGIVGCGLGSLLSGGYMTHSDQATNHRDGGVCGWEEEVHT